MGRRPASSWRLAGGGTLVLTLALLVGCTSELQSAGTDGDAASSGSSGSTNASSAMATGSGGAAVTSGSGGAGATTTAASGSGGGAVPVDGLLDALRDGPAAAMQAQSEAASGWPAPVEGGVLFVSTDLTLDRVAGDHDDWAGTPMTHDEGFAWVVIDVAPGSRYKLTDGERFEADPWSRAYDFDENGRISLVAPSAPHLERHFEVGDAQVQPRTVRIWVPEGPATSVLYVHDGQNLFDPGAFFGGWKLQHSAPPGMMLVGIDNTGARMSEYTHVPDRIGGSVMGGDGDAYADFVESTVRALVDARYGEPAKVGVMGSSLGGLISLHIADRFEGRYDFAASLSGTVGWGSIALDNETMLERYEAAGHRGTALYVDSGGDGECFDDDGDGIEDDDPSASDNYCENRQLESILYGLGYTADVDVWHWWAPQAPHNEAAWASRVFRPLQIFDAL